MLNVLQPILVQRFGEKNGMALREAAQVKYDQLKPLAKKETPGRKSNLVNGIYPFVAIYQTLLEGGLTQDQAMEHMYAIMEARTRQGMRKTYEKMGKLPFFYTMFRFMFTKGLGGDSWDVDWVSNTGKRFEYNITRCLWHDACTELGCPELCRIFCRNDELNFSDVSRHLYFERESTLADGGDCCDFHFFPHKPEQ